MSLFGTPAIQSLAGLSQADRVAREQDRKRPQSAARRVRDEDQLDLEVQTAEADDAVESLGGNADEQTAEDRQKQDHYRPQQRDGQDRPRLDLSA